MKNLLLASAILLLFTLPCHAQSPTPPGAEPAEGGSSPQASPAPGAESPEEATSALAAAEAPAQGDAELVPERKAGDGAAAANLANALSGASGVKLQLMCTNCNAADLNMGGLGKDFANLELDGYRVMEGMMGVYALSMIPADDIYKYEILKGPGSVLTGPSGIGGGLNILTKDPTLAPKFHGEGLIGQYANGVYNASAAGKWKRWSGDILLTHGQSDPINPNGDGRNEQGDYDRDTYNGRTWVDITKRQTLQVGYNYYDEGQQSGPGSYNPACMLVTGDDPWVEENLTILRKEWTGSYQWRSEKAGTFTARWLDSNRKYRTWERDCYEDTLVPRYRIDQDNKSLGLRWERLLKDRVLLVAGYEQWQKALDVYDPFGGSKFPREFYTKDRLDDTAGYAEAQFAAGKRVDLKLGLRYDDQGYFGSATLPRATVTVKAAPTFNLSLALGEGYRAPPPIFEEVCCGTRLQSNKEVKSESSFGGLLNLNWLPRSNVKVVGGLFLYDFDDYIERFYVGHNGLNPVLRQINLSEARIQGVDINLEMRHGDRFFWGLGYTWMDPENQGPEWITLPGHPLEDQPETYWQGEDLYHVYQGLGAAFFRWEEKSHGLTVNLSGQYYDKMAIQRLNGNTQEVYPETYYSDAHQVWNLRVTKSVRDRLSLYAGVDNVFDEWQSDLGDPEFPTKWGPQRGIFGYAGFTINF